MTQNDARCLRPIVPAAPEMGAICGAGFRSRVGRRVFARRRQAARQYAFCRAGGITGLSEGTGDQLYLALRLAALQVQHQPDRMMPLVLDDVFITSDDERAANIFRALEKFSGQTQVLVFTHHQHLVDIASRTVTPALLRVHQLPEVFGRGS